MKKSQHDANLEHLLHQEIFTKIGNILVVGKEVQFYDGHKQLISEPDGIVFDGETLYIIEYKNNGDSEEEARSQLRHSERYVRQYLGINIPIKTLFFSGPKKDK